MMRKFLQNILINPSRSLCLRPKTDSKPKYDLLVGVLLERLPVVSKKFNEIEREVLQMLKKVEFENSMKSDHEVRKEKDLRQREQLKGGKAESDVETDTIVLQTAQDFEDAGQDELTKYTSASRETEDDKKNNTKSLNRKLDETLVLFCSHKLGSENIMLLPQGKWKKGETLKQTAERIVNEKFGDNLNTIFYGNAPIGFYKYKYPPSERQVSIGAKVFFFRAIYNSGDITDSKLHYEWLSNEELKNKIKSSSYFEAVSSFCCY